MAERGSRDLLNRLADAGEEAIQRLGDMPGAGRIVEALNGMRERIDELQRRVRALDELEKRADVAERRVNELGGGATGSPGGEVTADLDEKAETPGGKRAAAAVERSQEEHRS